MTLPTGCPTCDTHGPELDTVLSGFESLAFHRAAHDAARTIGESLESVVEAFTRIGAAGINLAPSLKSLQRPADRPRDPRTTITPRRRK